MQFEFPQYRKLADKAFYKIFNEGLFEELQKTGNKVKRYQFQASTYFDYLFIQNLLDLDNGRYQLLSEEDYLQLEKSAG